MFSDQVNKDTIALSLLTAAESGHAFSAYLPSYFTIKSFALDGDPAEVQRKVANLRSGYVPAIGFGLLLGGVVSVLAKSYLPLLTSAGAAVLMVFFYEGALPADIRLFSLPWQEPPKLERPVGSQQTGVIDLQPGQWREVPNFA